MAQELQRTHLLKRFAKALSVANDTICFVAFVNSEFFGIAEKAFEENQAKFTAQAFSKNAFAARTNLSFVDLIEAQNTAVAMSYKFSLISATEYILGYCKEAVLLLEEFSPDPSFLDPKLSPEEKIEHLVRWMTENRLESEIIDTISFFRQIRNQYSHALPTKTSEPRRLWKLYGGRLAKYWANKATKIEEFDFLNPTPVSLSYNVTIEQINLLRACLFKLDHTVAAAIPVNMAIAKEMKTILDRSPGVRADRNRLIRKLLRNISIRYGTSLKKETVIEVIDRI